jgi:hypothetical protein
MDIHQYKKNVIELFKSGKASESQWQAMARCVVKGSANDDVPEIDETIDSEPYDTVRVKWLDRADWPLKSAL